MLGSIWFLARMELKTMLRQRETILWTFIMPVLFFFFIGNMTGGFRSSGTSTTPLVVDSAANAGFLGDHLMTRLDRAGFRTIRGDTLSVAVNYARLAIPPAFTDSVLAGHQIPVTYSRSEGGLSADWDQVRVYRAVISLIADLMVGIELEGSPTEASVTRAAAIPRTLELEVRQAGKRRVIPTGFEQAIPGTMVMFTLLVLLTSGSILLVLERQQGLLRRLASSPVRRSEVMLGKWGSRIILGLIQIGFAMVIGSLLFKMNWGPNLPMLAVVLVVYAAFVAFLGILLGNLARTEGQAVGIGVLAANLLGALGGCWWPIEITPGWMQKLALALPSGWAMDAMHKLVNFGDAPSSVLPHVLVFVGGSVVLGWAATRTFRFR